MNWTLFLTLACATGTLLAQPTQQYSHGDPTDLEQLNLEFINRARANPSAEGDRLVNNATESVQGGLDFFNVDTQAVLDAFDAMQAVPPLAFHPDLIEAARAHTVVMIAQDQQSHQLAGEEDLRGRTVSAGYTDRSFLRENVYAYVEDVWYGHAGFQIDWTFITASTPDGIQNPPGHRIAIMDETNPDDPYTEIGIGLMEDTNTTGTNVTGPLVVTQDFGRPSDIVHYVLGVVYEDTDKDGFYSEGEGIEGVTLTPDQGDFFAVTSSSGGYAIPLVGVSGTVKLTASGSEIGDDMTGSFSFNSENVKIDFVITSTSGGGNNGGSNNGGGSTPTVQDPEVDFGSDSVAIGSFIVTTWFGGFFDLSQQGADPGWLYHQEHAGLYYVGDEDNLWFYSTSLGWSYTNRAIYPNIFSTEIGWILYFKPDAGEETTMRVFFDYDRSQTFFNDPTVGDDLFYF